MLHIFNHYLERGGEDGSIHRIADCIRSGGEKLSFYSTSSKDYMSSPMGKLKMPMVMQQNKKALEDLRELHNKKQFNFWLVHNVFPAMSVAVYELAEELEVPVIQYLHNYRFGCPGATRLRGGNACFECSPSNMLPALQHLCWRGSLPSTASMVLALQRFWNKGGYNSIHTFIAISESQKRRHEQMGIPAEKIHVLPHFLSVEEEVPRSGHGNDVLFLGRLTEEKGLMLLLRSWKRMNVQNRTLHIAGTGPMEQKLKKYCESHGVQGVKFHGFVDKNEHQMLYDQCSMLVAPSIWEEPFGMVVLEAWKHGKPILTTDMGSFPELIEHDVDGWLAPSDEDRFLKVFTHALMRSHKEMGKKGFAKLKNEFNSKTWLIKWNEIVDQSITRKID